MSHLTFSVHGRGPNGKFLSINTQITLPEFDDMTSAPQFDMKQASASLANDNLSIADQLQQLKGMEDKQSEANQVYSSAAAQGGLSKQDQVRAYAIKYLVEKHGNEISIADNPGKFYIKEDDIVLSEDPDGNYLLELQTVFG